MHDQWKHEGAAHFVTAVTAERVPIFLNDAACAILRDEFIFYARRYDVDLLAFVIMPDHFHALIFPNGQKTFSDYVGGVKGYFSKAYAKHTGRDVERLWQESFFDYLIFNRNVLNDKLDYILNNPVEDGLVGHPKDYKWLYVDEKKISVYMS
jgi:putative transposase